MQSRLQQREMSSPLDIHFGIAEVLVSFWTVGALPLCPDAVHPQRLTFSVDPTCGEQSETVIPLFRFLSAFASIPSSFSSRGFLDVQEKKAY